MKDKLRKHWRRGDKTRQTATRRTSRQSSSLEAHRSQAESSSALIPAFATPRKEEVAAFAGRMHEACHAWLLRSPSKETRSNYSRDVAQFLRFIGQSDRPEALADVRPHHVAAWRDSLQQQGLANNSIVRKLTALRSLFNYLQTYGYTGANPAHSKFVDTPDVPRDGKTVGLSPTECRRLLDAPDPATPVGIRDRAILATLAYSACRVGEIARMRIGDLKTTGGHHIVEVHGKGGKERRVPLHPEAVERLEAWIEIAAIRPDTVGPLFRAVATARGMGRDGFLVDPLTRRGIQYMLKRYAKTIGLDPAVTVHSFRVTALTTARERGVDIVDLQDFAGHANPSTTLGYIRNRDRLSKSPAYVLRY